MKIVTISTTYTFFDSVPDDECTSRAKVKLNEDVERVGTAFMDVYINREIDYGQDDSMTNDDDEIL